MRKFEYWLEYRVNQYCNINNLFYVDLGSMRVKPYCMMLSLGYKIKDEDKLPYWQSCEIDVELDFTKEEFIETCEKYNIKHSVFIGE